MLQRVLAVLAIAAITFGCAKDDKGDQNSEQLRTLKAELGVELGIPAGARLTFHGESGGDEVSGAASITWRYEFDGRSDEVLAYYRSVLVRPEWSEHPPQPREPGEIARFVKGQPHHAVIVMKFDRASAGFDYEAEAF